MNKNESAEAKVVKVQFIRVRKVLIFSIRKGKNSEINAHPTKNLSDLASIQQLVLTEFKLDMR